MCQDMIFQFISIVVGVASVPVYEIQCLLGKFSCSTKLSVTYAILPSSVEVREVPG